MKQVVCNPPSATRQIDVVADVGLKRALDAHPRLIAGAHGLGPAALGTWCVIGCTPAGRRVA